MAKDYTSEDIKVLNDREHVRLRTQVYLGNMTSTSYMIPIFSNQEQFDIQEIEFVPAIYKAVGEIIDNSIDEFAQIRTKNKTLKIEADPLNGWYRVADNGRGIPIDKHSSGKYTPEVALGSLRAGRNFGDDKEAGVIGQNGVGSACTNYCSSEFNVIVNRAGKKYVQGFEDGGHPKKPSIRKGPKTKTGTDVSFTLDDQVFKDVAIDPRLIRNKAIEVALTNPGVSVSYNQESWKFKRGIEDIARDMSKAYGGSYFKFVHEADGLNLEFYVIDGVYESLDEQMFTWVNSSLLFDGGLVNTQFVNAFVSKTTNHLATVAKREKIDITKNDVRQNLLVLANLKIADPEYDAQSKTRMTGPNLRSELSEMIETQWASFARKNKKWFQEVVERAHHRHHATENKKAIKEHKKVSSKKIKGLVDATSRYRHDCSLLVTEGESAASMITEARDPQTIGSFPLTGKINNVYGKTVAQVLNMGKLTDLLAACGLTPGVTASKQDLRYGKVVIATDADFDGDDIFTLLVNLFYQFWPELFEQEIIHRLVAPNVCLTKGNKRKHFATREAYDKQKSKYKGWEVHYYKGLGSMERADWDMILSGQTDTLIPITTDNAMAETLELLFGNDAEARKEWLQSELE